MPAVEAGSLLLSALRAEVTMLREHCSRSAEAGRRRRRQQRYQAGARRDRLRGADKEMGERLALRSVFLFAADLAAQGRGQDVAAALAEMWEFHEELIPVSSHWPVFAQPGDDDGDGAGTPC